MNLPAKILELGHKNVTIWLQTEMGFVGEIEGDYEAYCLYPSDSKFWPETDKAKVDRCWPILKTNNFKFIGAPQDTSSKAPKQFDGYLNGVATEIKSANFSADNSDILRERIKDKMFAMNSQRAVQGLLVFTEKSKVTSDLVVGILDRLKGSLKQFSTLRRVIIAFEKEKSILSFER